ncbi:ATP-binding protein [Sphingomonas sp. SORGH_AS_0879]|uniref:ATP-binding protein n=1 Tax=Sphingomonas sp. SORGH_AS_0879 TaxID=3041790 RepID=UPI002787165D|nr:ATP-binding protein [Sphingomonas sp. SORGH_AS_0879]MDQ1232266.1 hypothetical protein [Sphingomonas sp. SORGH_AS_0879]
MSLRVSDWKMVGLTLSEVGPFRSGKREFSFIGETAPADADPGSSPGPSNLYMLLAPNGMGKTTVMESIHGLFGLMADPVAGRFSNPRHGGAAQLDVRASWEIDGASQTVLLSIWTGADAPLKFWTEDQIADQVQAEGWVRLGLTSGLQGPIVLPGTDDLGRRLFTTIREGQSDKTRSLTDEPSLLPTVLYFPADRSLVAPQGERVVIPPEDWGYSPVYRFGHDGPEWRTTVDSLFVWLEWLGEENVKPFLDRVSRHVFEDESGKTILRPERAELTTYVATRDGPHPLAGLSHGERALLQMFGRIFSYSTSNTIVLIDEIELHLHTRWVNRMFRELKAMLVDKPGVSLFFSTHDRELIKTFDYENPEVGLTKGGFLIDEMN